MKSFKFTVEGLPIDSKDAKDRVIAAMSAAILHISKKFVKEYACGPFKRILIEADDEFLMLSIEGENGILQKWHSSKERGIVYLADF